MLRLCESLLQEPCKPEASNEDFKEIEGYHKTILVLSELEKFSRDTPKKRDRRYLISE